MARAFIIAVLALGIAACEPNTASEEQAQRGAARAEQIVGSAAANAEQDNISARLAITTNPNTLGYIALLNQNGGVVLYTAVRGKVTSSGKRLTDPVDINGHPRPSDEGTWGSSDSYIYFFTPQGQYMQWTGPYVYSNSPIRLANEPLILSVGQPATKVVPWDKGSIENASKKASAAVEANTNAAPAPEPVANVTTNAQ